MNYIDFTLSLFICWGAYRGFSRGLIKELTSILGLIIGIYLSKSYYKYLNERLYVLFDSEETFISVFSIIIIFLLTIMFFKIISKLLTKFVKYIALGLVNKLIGGCFGIIKSILIISVVIFIFSKFNNYTELIEKNLIEESLIYSKIEEISLLILTGN